MNTTPISVRLEPRVVTALDQAATDGFRSRSAQLTKYLIEGLTRDGFVRSSPERQGGKHDDRR